MCKSYVIKIDKCGRVIGTMPACRHIIAFGIYGDFLYVFAGHQVKNHVRALFEVGRDIECLPLFCGYGGAYPERCRVIFSVGHYMKSAFCGCCKCIRNASQSFRIGYGPVRNIAHIRFLCRDRNDIGPGRCCRIEIFVSEQ